MGEGVSAGRAGDAMGGRRRMDRRVSGRTRLVGLARCGWGRTGAAAGVALAMPVSFCTMSRNSFGLVSRIVVGVRRDTRGRRLLGGRDEHCRDDVVVESLRERPALSPMLVD
jgi:hypothetical protein